MRRATGDSESDRVPGRADELTIQEASRLLDVPAPTIRSWERRYGVPETNRSTGGHRRYTTEQVQALRRMRDAVARGQTPAAAAALAKTAGVRARETRSLIADFVSAAQRLSDARAVDVLETSRATVGLDATVDEVLLPAMRRIGQLWETARCDVAHEHLATQAVRAWLTGVGPDGRPPGDSSRPLLLSCGPDDQHTLGLESLCALLRQRGWDCRMLGASTPADSLATAIAGIRPAAVVLVSHLSVARRSAIGALQAALVHDTRLFYAGAAFVTPAARRKAPGSYLGESVSQAADVIAAAITRDAE